MAVCILTAMPRYHFHIRNHVETRDEEGQELADEEAARHCALEAARGLVCEDVHRGHLNLDHYIEVTDAAGRRLFNLSFREAFTIDGRP